MHFASNTPRTPQAAQFQLNQIQILKNSPIKHCLLSNY